MNPPYSTTWNTATSSVGAHVLTAVARDAAGNRATSVGVAVTVTAASSGQVTLAWDPNPESTVAGYDLYIGRASAVYTTKINVSNVTTYTVTGLAPGQVYYFAVTAYDQNGGESGYSNEVSTTIVASAAEPQTALMAKALLVDGGRDHPD